MIEISTHYSCQNFTSVVYIYWLLTCFHFRLILWHNYILPSMYIWHIRNVNSNLTPFEKRFISFLLLFLIINSCIRLAAEHEDHNYANDICVLLPLLSTFITLTDSTRSCHWVKHSTCKEFNTKNMFCQYFGADII